MRRIEDLRTAEENIGERLHARSSSQQGTMDPSVPDDILHADFRRALVLAARVRRRRHRHLAGTLVRGARTTPARSSARDAGRRAAAADCRYRAANHPAESSPGTSPRQHRQLANDDEPAARVPALEPGEEPAAVRRRAESPGREPAAVPGQSESISDAE